MRMVRVLSVVLCTLAIASPAGARTNTPTRLVYTRSVATSSCPDQSALESAVVARLGYDPFSPWGEQTIIASVVSTGDLFVARAELVNRDGIVQGGREVRAEPWHCDALIATLALAISITLDPAFAVEQQPHDDANTSDSTTELGSAPPREVELPSPPVRPRAPHREDARGRRELATERYRSARSSLKLHGLAGVAGQLEMAPRVTLAGRVGAGLASARVALWMEAWQTLPVSTLAEDGSGVSSRLLAGTLAPCAVLTSALSACALVSLGALNVTGRGVSDPRSRTVFYSAAGARAQLEVPLGTRLELLGNVDVAAILTRPRFQLENVDIWRPGSVAGSTGIAMAMQIF